MNSPKPPRLSPRTSLSMKLMTAFASLLTSSTHLATMMIFQLNKAPLRFSHIFKVLLMTFLRRSSESIVIPSLKSTVFMYFSTSLNPRDSGKFLWILMHLYLFSLKQADKKFIKNIAHRINVVPIIAKADSLSPAELTAFKTKITNDLMDSQIRIFDFASFGSSENIHAVCNPARIIVFIFR